MYWGNYEEEERECSYRMMMPLGIELYSGCN